MTRRTPKTPTVKWQLTAWPKGPRSIKVDGKNRTTRLWVRDYTDKKTALRAAPHIHRRYPDAIIELMPFEFLAVPLAGQAVQGVIPLADRRALGQDLVRVDVAVRTGAATLRTPRRRRGRDPGSRLPPRSGR